MELSPGATGGTDVERKRHRQRERERERDWREMLGDEEKAESADSLGSRSSRKVPGHE